MRTQVPNERLFWNTFLKNNILACIVAETAIHFHLFFFEQTIKETYQISLFFP